MIRTALAVVAGLSAAHGSHLTEPCSTCRAPAWSWARFPAFFHGCDPDGAAAGGGFTPEALATLTRFPIVTIEKWQGGGVVPSLWEEQAFVIAARQIKAANPAITVIAWLDSVRVYQQNLTLNPYAGYQCNTMGKLGAARYLDDPANHGLLLKNKTGGLVHEAMGCHVYNAGEPAGARAFQELCLNLTASGVIDGCGADASWINLTGTVGERQRARWGLTDAAATAWREGHQQSLRELSWPLLGRGLLLGKYPYEVGDYVSGALDENCPPHNDTINWLRDLQARQLKQGRPLYYECHYKPVDGNLSDAVAAFLIGVGPNQYFGLGAWEDLSPAGVGNFSGHWVDGVFGRKLGEPLADARYNPLTATWTRRFASGTFVTFNAVTQTGRVVWQDLPVSPVYRSSAPSGLRCNTYLATDFSSSGTGIETCVQGVTHCIQREAWPLGVRTYSMSCDDLFQCVNVKPNSCCSKTGSIGGGMVVRCATENFDETRINATDFEDPSCRQNCTSG